MRVLFLTHRLPYAPNRGDRLRAYHMLRSMRTYADVDVVSLVHDDEEASHVVDLEAVATSVTALRVSRARGAIRAARALIDGTTLTHALLDAPGADAALASLIARQTPDVVLAFCSGMARFGLQAPLDRLPLVVDLVDVDSSKWRALAATARWPFSAVYAREARRLAAFESTILARAATTIVVNDREADVLRAQVASAEPAIVENGVDLDHFAPARPAADGRVVVFTGVMNYAPNADGAVWFAHDVWPHVRRRCPDATLLLVGATPRPDVEALARTCPGVTVTGTVPSVREYLWRAAVAVAPLHVARGVQNKVVEAVAAGVPCVVTPAVGAGVPPAVMPACVVRDSALSFADAVCDLLERAPAARRALAGLADVSALAWPSRLQPLRAILERAATHMHEPVQS